MFKFKLKVEKRRLALWKFIEYFRVYSLKFIAKNYGNRKKNRASDEAIP